MVKFVRQRLALRDQEDAKQQQHPGREMDFHVVKHATSINQHMRHAKGNIIPLRIAIIAS